jgi:predicted transcriptional regulator of viral defense system
MLPFVHRIKPTPAQLSPTPDAVFGSIHGVPRERRNPDRPRPPERSPRARPGGLDTGRGSKTGNYFRKSTHLAIAEVAARQHTVLGLTDLRGAGLSDHVIHKRVGVGQLHRVHQGVYSLVPPQLLTLRGRFMAAVLACGPGAVLSHRSAAALHGLRATSRARIEVTVPGRNRRRHDGVQVHRSTTLTVADVTTVDGIPVTTIARTVADLTDVLPERAVERVLEQGAVMEVLDGRALEDQVTRHRRGACLRQLLERGRIDAPTESDLEERFLLLCRAGGFPEPQRQVYLDPDDGGPMVRADFLWREQRLIIETDSARFHGTRSSFESDRRRDQRLILAGWRVIRITWRQITERPDEVVALLRRLLAGD